MRATHRVKARHRGEEIVVLGYRCNRSGKWHQWPDKVPIPGDLVQIQNIATNAIIRQMKTPTMFKKM